MRRPMLLMAVLAGCLNLSALAEAKDRHGQSSHQSFGHSSNSFGRQSFGGRSFGHQSFRHQQDRSFGGGRSFGPGHDTRWFGDRQSRHWSGPPSGRRGFEPPHRRPQFGWGQPRWRFGSRQHGVPFVGGPGRLGRSFVTVHRHSPRIVRVFPGHGFAPRRHGFGPHGSGGLTIILREPAASD